MTLVSSLERSKAPCGTRETGVAPVLSLIPFGCSWTQFAPPENGKALYFNNLKGLLFARNDKHYTCSLIKQTLENAEKYMEENITHNQTSQRYPLLTFWCIFF